MEIGLRLELAPVWDRKYSLSFDYLSVGQNGHCARLAINDWMCVFRHKIIQSMQNFLQKKSLKCYLTPHTLFYTFFINDTF